MNGQYAMSHWQLWSDLPDLVPALAAALVQDWAAS